MPAPTRRHLAALVGFVALATLLTWPLPRHLGTHLTGAPGGDTGVYVWNLWVFSHEIGQGRLPFYTSSILSAPDTGGPANLSLHNYTTFSNLLALPLIPHLGLVTTFNLILLLNMVLSAYCMFLLARHMTGTTAEAWLAGALFMAAPVLVSRAVGHFSLVAAAPLPLFILLFRLSAITGQLRYGVAAGATVAWAISCDAYYGVFCVMLGAAALAAHLVDVHRAAEAPSLAVPLRRALNVLIIVVAFFVIGMAVRGGGPIVLFGVRLSMRTLYTPMLVLSLLVVLRLVLSMRPRLALNRDAWSLPVLRSVAAGGLVSAVMLSPVLYAFGERYLAERSQMPPIYWRSSPAGVDLLAFLMPNPNHPLWGDGWRDVIVRWSGRADGFPEYVGSLPWVALAVLAIAWWRTGWRLTRIRIALSLLWISLALGPFVHVAGLNTLIPTPWAFLRYLPLVSLVRSPSRFAVIVTTVVAVLFGMALAHICRAYPARRRAILATVALLLTIELWPAPRPLYSASIPPIYQIIRDDPREDVRILELPFGVRDGTSSIGNFSALSQFYQTLHGKALVGGYLSRVSPRRKRLYQQLPVLNALMTMSERTSLTAEQEAAARAGAERFLSQARLGYVVINHHQSPPELVRFATELLGLNAVASDGPITVYVPRQVPRATAGPADRASNEN